MRDSAGEFLALAMGILSGIECHICDRAASECVLDLNSRCRAIMSPEQFIDEELNNDETL